MLEKIRKHGLKISVFAINILIAAIAVFILREKDEARILNNAQKEKEELEGLKAGQEVVPSFEGSADLENQTVPEMTAETEDQPASVPSEVSYPTPDPAIVVPPAPPANTAPENVIPESTPQKNTTPVQAPKPAKKKKPADTKTKTS